MSIERIVRAFGQIAQTVAHGSSCTRTLAGLRDYQAAVWYTSCDCDHAVRVLQALGETTMEALKKAHADGAANIWGHSIGLWDTVLPIFERAGQKGPQP